MAEAKDGPVGAPRRSLQVRHLRGAAGITLAAALAPSQTEFSDRRVSDLCRACMVVIVRKEAARFRERMTSGSVDDVMASLLVRVEVTEVMPVFFRAA